MLIVSAGKKKVSADAVAGEKFLAGGVAMKIEFDAASSIVGQVGAGRALGGDGRKGRQQGKDYQWEALRVAGA